ncbi:5-formyltetrahydrofolate cyclo-ligase [Lactobacillus sp. ESL0791]|uniref:5-formyltetrahydrofolate cyclo-ligase n=1 Tax=Lactobacillus sp. ESL0791 TaxID=2983234 RepID=UPI0023F9D074|nr:5-formyltetrahydrofolate cyclo-ligase [Lactobacillus sp. ESL0791]MDF7639142.1 5-formyltetrahydrofolate cyclo-ligase [Lactobacillus sp. ESL0791]
MDKKDLRKKQIKLLAEYAKSAKKDEEDQLLLEQLMGSDLIKNSRSIGVTASLPSEVDTSRLIARLWDQGKDVYLARANNDHEHTQDFVYYTYMTKLKKSRFGVKEVDDATAPINNELDLIVVPGLAFALDSHQRLNFGGGYYDRFLAKHPASQTVALVNSKMSFQTAVWPVEKTDVPVQTIILPDQILRG